MSESVFGKHNFGLASAFEESGPGVQQDRKCIQFILISLPVHVLARGMFVIKLVYSA